jgi:hypothetical protein
MHTNRANRKDQCGPRFIFVHKAAAKHGYMGHFSMARLSLYSAAREPAHHPV